MYVDGLTIKKLVRYLVIHVSHEIILNDRKVGSNMGKLKNQMIADAEQEFIRQEKRYLSGRDISSRASLCRINEPSDEDLARFDKEFNDWLDAYERSFGNGEYL